MLRHGEVRAFYPNLQTYLEICKRAGEIGIAKRFENGGLPTADVSRSSANEEHARSGRRRRKAGRPSDGGQRGERVQRTEASESWDERGSDGTAWGPRDLKAWSALLSPCEGLSISSRASPLYCKSGGQVRCVV